MKRIEFRAMGSRMLALLDSSAGQADESLVRLPAWFEEWEQALSRFRPDSELSRLNRSGGRPVRVSKTLWEVFHAAREAGLKTGGLVTPTVLDALLKAGYDRSFEMLSPEQAAYAETIHAPLDPAAAIGWDASTRSLTLPVSVQIDFGGVAKGWAAHSAMERLARYGPALVDAGGDIAISGPRPAGDAWPIGINNPFESGVNFDTLRLGRCGVATSGKDYHRWLRDGNLYHHIIDPRSGAPAATDILAVTVVAPTVLDAEAAAKAVFILGSRAGLEWLEADPDLAGVLVLDDGGFLYSRRLSAYLWR
jgi:thiamine biosynthesis lipoprotein